MWLLLLLAVKWDYSRRPLLLPVYLIHWKLSSTVENHLGLTESPGKIHYVLCAGGKITMKGFHISWLLPSFNRVIFRQIDMYYRMKHNTDRAASFGTTWVDISDEKEMRLRPLASDSRRKWDRLAQAEAVSCPQFLKHRVEGCLEERLTR